MSENVIQGPFYNSGFYNTGAGGGGEKMPAEWFNKYKWNGNASLSINGNSGTFEQALFDNGMGFGALRIFEQIDLSSTRRIEFGLKVYLQRRTGTNSATATLFDCQTIPGIENNKIRLAKIEYDGGAIDETKIKISIPRSNNQWSSNIEIPIEVPNDININLIFDYQNNRFIYKVNETEGEDVITVTTPPSNFCPCYFMRTQAYQLNNFSYPYLWYSEKMYLKGSFVKADNDIIYGCE